MPFLLILWQNRELIAKILGVLLLVLVVWWFGFHMPATIKKQAAEITRLEAERVAAHGAINLLIDIGREHARISEASNVNIIRIRDGKKPSRTGYLLLPGLLPPVYQAYTTSR